MGFLIFFAIAVIVAIIAIIININFTKKVKQHSKRLYKLKSLNNGTLFIDVDDVIVYHKHYDNKRNFNRIEPAYLMAADIRNNLRYVSDLCEKIKSNRNLYDLYVAEVNQISSNVREHECKELKIPLSIYKWIEEKLFQKNILSPVLDIRYKVIMTYSSPKGQVNLKKEEEFNFENILNCMESVSRRWLDKKTYDHISRVERGEVSDSMRYDIMNRDGFKCVICGASAKEGAHLHIDHIVPISKGGKSVPSNLRTLCERCNIGKSNKIERF